MELPNDVRLMLKPGLMLRTEPEPETWLLFDPLAGIHFRFTLNDPQEGDFCPADLESDDLVWQDGQLCVDRYHGVRLLRRHTAGRVVNLEINHLCHYGCRHCFQLLVPADNTVAQSSADEIRETLKRLLALKPAEIAITGGDIFLHPDIWELLDDFHRASGETTFRVLVNGGGLDLDDDAVRARLARLAGRRIIVKSDFFGHNAKLHDEFTRVPGSFDRLVRIVEEVRRLGITCIPSGVLTQENFATRFELVNFLFNLSDDRFTITSILYPSDYRHSDALGEIRLSDEQYTELMDEEFFAPLVGQYHSFEQQCSSDCQISVVGAGCEVWGCSFLKESSATLPDVGAVEPATEWNNILSDWRQKAVSLAEMPECGDCPARGTCRKCPSFLSASQVEQSYCNLSRAAHDRLAIHVQAALDEGFAFVDPNDRERLSFDPVVVAGIAIQPAEMKEFE